MLSMSMLFPCSVSFFSCMLQPVGLRGSSRSDLKDESDSFSYGVVAKVHAQVHAQVHVRRFCWYLWAALRILWVKQVSLCVSSWYLCRSWLSRWESVLSASCWNTSLSDWSRRSAMDAWSWRQEHSWICRGRTKEADFLCDINGKLSLSRNQPCESTNVGDWFTITHSRFLKAPVCPQLFFSLFLLLLKVNKLSFQQPMLTFNLQKSEEEKNKSSVKTLD